MLSNSKNILDERFASGEIDVEEYQRLLGIIKKSPSGGAQTDPQVSAQSSYDANFSSINQSVKTVESTHESSSSLWLWVLIGGAGIISFLFLIGVSELSSTNSGASADATSLTKGRMEYKAGRITLSIANTSNQSGDIFLYVEYEGIQTCEHIVEMRAGGTITDLSFPCEVNSSDGKFLVVHGWASNDKGLAAISKRISVDWDK